MNLIEGIQEERKRVEELRKEYVAIGASGQLALVLTIDPALKEADASIASGDTVRMLAAFQGLKGIAGEKIPEYSSVLAARNTEIAELREKVLWLEKGSLCNTCGYEYGDCISEPVLSDDDRVVKCKTYIKREIDDERWEED